MKKIIPVLSVILCTITCNSTMCHAKTQLTYFDTVVYEQEYELSRTEVFENVVNSAKKEKEAGTLPSTNITQNITDAKDTSSSLKTIMFNSSNGIFRK